MNNSAETNWELTLDYRTLTVGPNYIHFRSSDGFVETEEQIILFFTHVYDMELLELELPEEANTGENFSFSARVRNKGPQDSPQNILLHFYVGNIQKEQMITVQAGETREVTVKFKLAEAGSFTGRVVVNPGMGYLELEQGNNEMTATSGITIIDDSITPERNDGEDTDLFGDTTLLLTVGVLVGLFALTGVGYYTIIMKQEDKGEKSPKQVERLLFKDNSAATPVRDHTVKLKVPEDEREVKKELESRTFAPTLTGTDHKEEKAEVEETADGQSSDNEKDEEAAVEIEE